MRCFRVSPSRNSMARNGCPSSCPISWMVQMLGWLRAEAARASRRKRSNACGSCATSYIVRKKFKGDKSAERDVLSLVDHAHTAAPEFLDNAVVRDSTPDHTRPIVVWSITGGKSYVGEKGKSMKAVELAGSGPRLECQHGSYTMTIANWRVTISLKGRWPRMSISIHPELETKLRARAQAEGLSVEAYLERLVRADQSAEDELTALALRGTRLRRTD